MSNSLQPHGLRHTRFPCPSPSPGVGSNSCPLSQWCPQPSHPLLSPSPPAINLSQHQGLFQWVSSLQLAANRWPLWSTGSQSIGVEQTQNEVPTSEEPPCREVPELHTLSIRKELGDGVDRTGEPRRGLPLETTQLIALRKMPGGRGPTGREHFTRWEDYDWQFSQAVLST